MKSTFLGWGLSVVTMASVATAVLLATGWGSAVAANVSSVFVTNTASNPVPVTPTGTVPVHEQGTANVNVTNSSISVTPPGAVSQVCKSNSYVSDSLWVVPNDLQPHSICSGDFYVTSITVAGFNSNAASIEFRYKSTVMLNLLSSPFHGSDSYQLNLTHPLHVDDVEVYCSDVNPCQFELAMLGNSTGA